MITTSEVAGLVLSFPGNEEQVKLDAKLSRKVVLLLSYIVDWGMTAKADDKGTFLEQIPPESLKEITELVDGLMGKAGLISFKENIRHLAGKKTA